jgi:2-succinyl-6-hydroxy-2,4-cyclohexadiene-1-carboxylate synthase
MSVNQVWPCSTIGTQDKAAVVCLHGFLGEGRDWEFMREPLGSGYFGVFPDLPGHGQNREGLPEKPISFSWLSHGLAATLDRLNVQTFHLLGYSLGGRLALHFTLKYPQRVRSLILENASPGLAGRAERRARRVEDERRAALLRAGGMGGFLEEWYRAPLFASLKNRPDILESQQARRAQNDPEAMARVISELSPGRQPSLWGKLDEFQLPVLLLAGALDTKYSAAMRQMASALRIARLEIAAEAGHNVHLEMPEWYLRTVEEYISEF